MSSGLTVFGVGVVTHDAELKTVGKNQVCNVSLVFNRSFKNAKGEWEKDPFYVKGEVWGQAAERLVAIATKGQVMYVTGRMKQGLWESKDGEKKTLISLSIDDFQACQKIGTMAATAAPAAETQQPKPKAKPQPAQVAQDDNDMPF